MAASSPSSLLLLLMIFLTSIVPGALAKSVNTTKVLAKFDHLSTFNKYLSETGVVREVDTRSSITLLIPPNAILDPVIASIGANNLLVIADILRYHCLLQYLELSEIRTMTNSTGILLTTLFQTTGRATDEHGFLNVSVSRGAVHLGLPVGAASFNATIVKNITQHPYDMSYMEIDHVLMPLGLGIPQAAAGSVNNVTATLKSKGSFNTFLGLLGSTGVDSALKSMSAVTLLAPTDDAFKAVPPNTLASLTQAEKIRLLQFHAIPTYFTLGSLETVSTPLPTLASATSGGYTVNVTTAGKGVVSFVTGLNKAELLETEMDNPPVAVYSINRVLLPPEIFAVATGPSPAEAPSPLAGPVTSPAPSPGLAPTPSAGSPTPTPTPAPALAPVAVPVASPPAPPAATPTGGSASALSPEAAAPGASKNGALGSRSMNSGVLGFVSVVAAASAALFL